jgi:hypothetical protein
MSSETIDADGGIQLHPQEFIFERPELGVTESERAALGPLMQAISYTDNAVDMLNGLLWTIQTELGADLHSSQPVRIARALTAISRAYEILARAGYTDVLPLHDELVARLNWIARLGRRELMRRLLSGSDEEAKDITRFFVSLIESGSLAKEEFSRLAELLHAVEACASPIAVVEPCH